MKQYEDFMKKVEEDPFRAVFGKTYSTWMGDNSATGTASPASNMQKHNSTLKPEKPQPKDSSPVFKGAKETLATQDSGSRELKRRPETVSREREEDYYIDPITLHKVSKKTVSSPAQMPATDDQNPLHIPVKVFRASAKDALPSHDNSNSANNRMHVAEAPRTQKTQDKLPWLAQEGFSHSKEQNRVGDSTRWTQDKRPKAVSKIESALDRHLQGTGSRRPESQRASLQYKPQDNLTEDLDLLRSSDVRASAGLRGQPAKENEATKQARQRKLEDDYEKIPLHREEQLARELSAQDNVQEKSKDRGVPRSTVELKEHSKTPSNVPAEVAEDVLDNQSYLKNLSTPLSNESVDWEPPEMDLNGLTASQKMKLKAQGLPGINKDASRGNFTLNNKASKIKAQIVPLKAKLDAMKADYDVLRNRWLEENRRQRGVKKAAEIHEDEVNAQKTAMEAMETRSVQSSDNCKPVLAPDLEPKPQLPEGPLPGEGDMASNVHEFAGRDRWYKQKAPHANELEVKLQRLAKERALVCEIKSIYEDKYGTINAEHRQSSPPSSDSRPLTDADSLSPITHARSPPKGHIGPSDTGTKNLSKTLTTSQSKELDEPQSSETLAIVQKLFNALRKAQTIIQTHHSDVRQKPTNDEPSCVSHAVKEYEQIVSEISTTALKLAETSRGLFKDTDSQNTVDAEVIADYGKPSPHVSTSDTPGPSVYKILAYDPSVQKVSTAKTTTLVPFAEERSLMPDEALKNLSNPGKFLPHVVSLHNQGYEIISSATNILVFKKVRQADVTDDNAEPRIEESMKHTNPVDGTTAPHLLNYVPPSYDAVTLTPRFPPDIPEDQKLPPPASVNRPFSGKVHRKEDVFSGASRGHWQNGSNKKYKSKHQKKDTRSARRLKTLKRMLMFGAFTAACCYATGVAVEWMR